MQYAWILIVTSIVGGQEYKGEMVTTVSGGDPIVSVARFNTQVACEKIAQQISGSILDMGKGIGHSVSAECVMVSD
jgi:hypothetical protein